MGTEAKSTPGPSRCLENSDDEDSGAPITVCDASDNDLANVYSVEDATVNISREAAIANARLIAAAPDLADLARNVAAFDDALLKSADLNVIRAALHEFREQARAAIAKATQP